MTQVMIGLSILSAISIGIALGFALAFTKGFSAADVFGRQESLVLPSQIYDRNNELITEFFAEEKRDIVTVNELPKHLIYAIVSREDKNFYRHNGFDLYNFIRAVVNNVLGRYQSGGSTISQQVAGGIFADRSDRSIKRKLVELWYSYQMEKVLTKDQILELYFNKTYFGHNAYGVDAAAQFYFGHSATDVTLAESVILAVQIPSPAYNSPINHPNRAKTLQKAALDNMVDLGYSTAEDASRSFEEYWATYDYTRSNTTTAYFEREDQAPYFSEYVRLQLGDLLYGSLDIHRDGFRIHTTLDLDMQRAADEQMQQGLRTINATFRANNSRRLEYADKVFLPLLDTLSLAFNIGQLSVSGVKDKKEAQKFIDNELTPIIDLLSLGLGSSELSDVAFTQYLRQETDDKKSTVEGALITLENGTGHILAMVGGSEFKTKKYNRAVDSKVLPGSSFKPLYYSAAISSRKFTPATMIFDAPAVFTNPDGTKYQPMNYLGEWVGPVRLRIALARSMNVPSVKVLEGIGFDAAIQRASNLLDMDEKYFDRVFPLGLGIVSVAPIQMARAYSTFPNQGKAVDPLAIRYIEDANGTIILENEKNMIKENSKREPILTPQEAYIMVNLLQSTVAWGTLARRARDVGGFDGMEMAGKTGTHQNWSNAWTVGFSPYYTTAVWFGFDLPGNSLGLNQTGATAAGPVWANYMKTVHSNLPKLKFAVPENGLIKRQVCSVSGMLPTEQCDEGTVEEIFLLGTQPTKPCDYHTFTKDRDLTLVKRIQDRLLLQNFSLDNLETPTITPPRFGTFDLDTDADRTDGDSEEGNPLLD